MARLDVDIICSRCENSLSTTSDTYYNKILPCDCVVEEIETLENKIKELEEKIESNI